MDQPGSGQASPAAFVAVVFRYDTNGIRRVVGVYGPHPDGTAAAAAAMPAFSAVPDAGRAHIEVHQLRLGGPR